MLRYSDIIFNPVGHTYTAPDGRALRGITGMLSKQLFPDEYAEVPKAILDNAAERGSNIHAQVEFCDDFGTTNDTPEVVNYQRLIKERGLEPIESEYLVSDNEHFVHRQGVQGKRHGIYPRRHKDVPHPQCGQGTLATVHLRLIFREAEPRL
mgnify:CR=1 FL=1